MSLCQNADFVGLPIPDPQGTILVAEGHTVHLGKESQADRVFCIRRDGITFLILIRLPENHVAVLCRAGQLIALGDKTGCIDLAGVSL